MDRDDREPEVGAPRPEGTLPPQTERKHPSEWEGDLNPNRLEGQNIGVPSQLPNARQFSDLRRSLTEFESDELDQIRIVPEGRRLQQGATYLDLRSGGRKEFTATGDMVAGRDDRLVPKSDTPYTLWNRLRGIEDPERTT